MNYTICYVEDVPEQTILIRDGEMIVFVKSDENSRKDFSFLKSLLLESDTSHDNE